MRLPLLLRTANDERGVNMPTEKRKKGAFQVFFIGVDGEKVVDSKTTKK